MNENRNFKSGSKLRIVIADGSELYSEMLKMVLDDFPNSQVLGIAINGQQALELVKLTRPDLLLLDLYLPFLNGLDTLGLIRNLYPGTQVLILAADDTEALRETCLAQGAYGFVFKPRLYTELRLWVTKVLSSPPESPVLAKHGASASPCGTGFGGDNSYAGGFSGG